MSRNPTFSFQRWLMLLLAAAVAVTLHGCSKEGSDKARAKKDEHGHEEKGGKHADEKGGDHGHGEKKAGAAVKLTDAEINQAGIKVDSVTEETVRELVVVTATIQANQDRMAHVAARVPGRIVRVNASLGQRVSAGQALATLDSIDVGEARSVYRQAASEVSLAQADFNRYEGLYKDKIVPQKEVLRARAQLEKSQTALRAAAEKLRMLGTSPEGQGSVFPVSAPFAGTIIEKKAVLGELAEPKDPLFTVADLSTVWIEANIFERDLGRLKIGADATVTVSAYPNETFRGKLRYIANVMDKETRTARARIEVPNPGERLRVEMFATAAIQTESEAKALIVPEEAVVLINNQPNVYVEHSDGFEPMIVELGEKLRGRVVVKSGIRPGDTVVTAGAYALKARQLKGQLGSGHAH